MSTQFGIGRVRADHVLVAAVLFLTGLGLAVLYSASYTFSQRFMESAQTLFFEQVMLAAVGIFLFFAALRTDLDRFRKLIPALVAISFILCLATHLPFIGVTKNGAARWIKIGPVTGQPSELVKLVIPLYLAHYFAKKENTIDSLVRGVAPPTLVGFAFFIAILAQNNFSTAMFLVCNILFMFYLAGMKARYFVAGLFFFGPLVVFLVLLKEHRLRRVLSFINPEFEPQNAGYQVRASIGAISSGGFWGKGIGQGTLKVSSIPEVHSDFIFSAYAEELGFAGIILLCIAFAVFAVRGYSASLRNEKPFYRLLGCGLVTMIVSQALLNIAVSIGALPATGVPLPFFSAGGSSLIATLIMAGVVVNVSRFAGERGRPPLPAEEAPAVEMN